MKVFAAILAVVAFVAAPLVVAVGFFAPRVVAETNELPAEVTVGADAPRVLRVSVLRSSLSTNDRVRLVSVDCTGEGVTARRTEKLPLVKGRGSQTRQELTLKDGRRTIRCVETEPPDGAAGVPPSPFVSASDAVLFTDVRAVAPKYLVMAGISLLAGALFAALAVRLR